jgi:adenylosuccinate lyase
MPEQDLDHADVGLLLQQVGGEGVPQRVHRDALVQLGGIRGGMNRPIELPGAQRIDGIQAGKQPAARQHLALALGHPPPTTQTFEHQRREHRVAILLPLAALDAQRHALAVDVTHLQRNHLAGAQSCAVGQR